MSRNILIIAAVLLICSAQQVFCESESENELETIKEYMFQDFQVRIYIYERGQDRLGILKKGRRIYEQQAEHRFFLYDQYVKELEDLYREHLKSIKVEDEISRFYREIHPEDAYESVPIGRDLTGRGIPNLVICEWTGGAHCCYKFHVFELGENVRTVAVFDAVHSDFAHFADLDGDNIPEFIMWDWTFAYWHVSFAGSPAPKMILRFDKDKYVLAEKLMRKPVPSDGELKAKIREIQREYSSNALICRKQHLTYDYPPSSLWETMLDLIYTGNTDTAWNKRFKGKKKFLREFREQLKTSPYWAEIEKMNKEQDNNRMKK